MHSAHKNTVQTTMKQVQLKQLIRHDPCLITEEQNTELVTLAGCDYRSRYSSVKPAITRHFKIL